MARKILLIDDEQDILDVLELILSESGYEIIVSRTGNILHQVSEIAPDLILLDEWLPEINGHELCKTLKTDQLTRNIPVILISAVPNLEKIAVECLAEAYIEKPFDLAHLMEVITSILDKAVNNGNIKILA